MTDITMQTFWAGTPATYDDFLRQTPEFIDDLARAMPDVSRDKIALAVRIFAETGPDHQPILNFRRTADQVLMLVTEIEQLDRARDEFPERLNRAIIHWAATHGTLKHVGLSALEVPSTMKQIQMIRTPSGPLALVRQTAEKLLAEGVISGTIDGDLHASDAATVKAAIMASAVCDFCSSPGASHYFDVPDFSIGKLPGNMGAGKSTGGWMACDECDDLIRHDKRDALVKRCMANMAFPKFSQRAIEELMQKFWAGMDERVQAMGVAAELTDFIEDRMPAGAQAMPAYTARDARVAGIARITGLTRDEIESAVAGTVTRDAVAKLTHWRKQIGRSALSTAAVVDLLAGVPPKKPAPADLVPHWQRALDAKFLAMNQLVALIQIGTSRSEFFKESVDLNDRSAVQRLIQQAEARTNLRDMGFDEDAKLLRYAQAYSFNAETTAAIREAAKSIPHEAPLSSVETPNTGAGWFWFAEPLPVTASPMASERVNALLWGWIEGVRGTTTISIPEEVVQRLTPDDLAALNRLTDQSGPDDDHHRFLMNKRDVTVVGDMLRRAGVTQRDLDAMRVPGADVNEPAIVFSAYVLDEKGSLGVGAMAAKIAAGTPIPSTRWYWPFSMSFHDMLAFNERAWDDAYGPGRPLHGDAILMGKDATLKCIAELSLFFAMSCVWFKQTVPVLVKEAGHIERHARKRYVRDHKLSEPPTVQVVALRKSARVPSDQAPSDRQAGVREYHCRWIVQGHNRLQPVGPGRKERKLIWIDAYTKGPDDKPLRTRDKVYAVVR